MQGTEIPAERDVVIEDAEADPGLVGRWTIDQREQDARDHLHQQQHRGCAAEDVPPAGVVRRGVMGRGLGERLEDAEPMLDPLVGFDGALFQAGHVDLGGVESVVAGAIWTSGFGLLQDACVASVGMSPAWIISELLAIW